MNISWVVSSLVSQSQTGELVSSLASARYRVIIPGTLLAKKHKVNIFNINENIDLDLFLSSDIVIFSKSLTYRNVLLAIRANDAGIPIVLDVCDDHSQSNRWQDYYQSLYKLATHVVVSTETLLSVVKPQVICDCSIILDPYEMEREPPHFYPEKKLNLLWFGSLTNLDTLLSFLPSLRNLVSNGPVVLSIVTQMDPKLLNTISSKIKGYPANITISVTPWSLIEMKKQFSIADIVIIPTLDNHKKVVKSPNRLIEGMWSGCYVVAGDLPSYRDFSDWACVGNDLISGIQDAVSNAECIASKIRDAQDYIAIHHNPDVIANAWEQCLEKVLSNNPPKKVTLDLFEPKITKLNLGCGDKILFDYTNVDVVESRAGKSPDVICDLHELKTFDDNSIDEILSVHVVEHFWRWEVIDILKEWVRVLKPGGKMILECPNLISACEAFLQDPDKYSGEGLEGQRTMWVFYGDPRWKDPLMNHRWAYTPNSLAKTMQEAGLINMSQEPAQFKLKEPRDMRIVGVKPE